MEGDPLQSEVQIIPGNAEVWYPNTLAPRELIDPGSQRLATGQCTNASGPDLLHPALTITLPTYTPRFHVEFEPCFIAPPIVSALTPYGLGTMALVLAFRAYLMMQRPEVA
jgi:hypothetical protein